MSIPEEREEISTESFDSGNTVAPPGPLASPRVLVLGNAAPSPNPAPPASRQSFFVPGNLISHPNYRRRAATRRRCAPMVPYTSSHPAIQPSSHQANETRRGEGAGFPKSWEGLACGTVGLTGVVKKRQCVWGRCGDRLWREGFCGASERQCWSVLRLKGCDPLYWAAPANLPLTGTAKNVSGVFHRFW